jgi:hypothetical protein
MRYPQGSIQLNEFRDLPLLRQILRSEFVTHSQLFEFMYLNHHEHRRKSFDWRLRRLVERELVHRQIHRAYPGKLVYSIAPSAALLLQATGEYCLLGRGRFNGKEAERSVLHAIGLNEIQLSVLRARLLVRWTGAIEVRSQNELTGFGFAKDYDAIITVTTKAGEQRFALEYERSPKTVRYYREIAALMSREAHVNFVLYLVANYDLLQFVSSFFRNAGGRVLCGLESNWHTDLLDMRVTAGSAALTVCLAEALIDPAGTMSPDARST